MSIKQNIFDILGNIEIVVSLSAIILSFLAVFFAYIQTKIARKSMELTRKSIDKYDLNRQLELLPKHGWIIYVFTKIDTWEKRIKKNIDTLNRFKKNQSESLEELNSNISDPTHLGITEEETKEMPNWLTEVFLSAAQYYYLALTSSNQGIKDNVINNIESANLYLETNKDCWTKIKELKQMLENMIPETILETPASISNSKFIISDSNPRRSREQ